MWSYLYFLGSHSTDCSDWVYFSEPDPTDGYVLYQTREDAINKNLAVVTNGVAIISVDDVSTVSVGGQRPSWVMRSFPPLMCNI